MGSTVFSEGHVWVILAGTWNNTNNKHNTCIDILVFLYLHTSLSKHEGYIID